MFLRLELLVLHCLTAMLLKTNGLRPHKYLPHGKLHKFCSCSRLVVVGIAIKEMKNTDEFLDNYQEILKHGPLVSVCVHLFTVHSIAKL